MSGPCAVSVVVPVFNPGPRLHEQLEALANQSGFQDRWEVVVADNGCTDGSVDDLAAYSTRLAITVVDASDRPGPAHARNVGARAARGEWLAFVDGDDVVGPEWLLRLWEARAAGDVIAGACDVTLLNDAALLRARGGAAYGRSLPQGPCDFLAFASSANVLVGRTTFQRLGGWDEALPYCEDVDFSWRAQLAGDRLAFAPRAVVHYRYRSSSRGVFTQMRRYKAAEVLLFTRFRTMGAKRATPRVALRRLWWVASRSPYALLDRERRYLWWSIAGAVVGCIQGSWRCRVIYL